MSTQQNMTIQSKGVCNHKYSEQNKREQSCTRKSIAKFGLGLEKLHKLTSNVYMSLFIKIHNIKEG